MAKLPSHLTPAQTSRYLGWRLQRVYDHTRRGGDLEAEKILGTWMIPSRRVQELKAKQEAGS